MFGFILKARHLIGHNATDRLFDITATPIVSRSWGRPPMLSRSISCHIWHQPMQTRRRTTSWPSISTRTRRCQGGRFSRSRWLSLSCKMAREVKLFFRSFFAWSAIWHRNVGHNWLRRNKSDLNGRLPSLSVRFVWTKCIIWWRLIKKGNACNVHHSRLVYSPLCITQACHVLFSISLRFYADVVLKQKLILKTLRE